MISIIKQRLKTLILLSGLFLITLPLYSQSDQEAQKIMEKLSAKLQSYKNLQADFTFTLYAPQDDIKDTQKGKLVLQGNKYRLEVMGILAICNGELLWSINKGNKEVYVLNPDDNELFNPTDIFALVTTDFHYSLVSQSGNLNCINMIPKETNAGYQKILMEINRKKEQISKVTYFSDDGNQYIIEITSFISNQPIDDSFFLFNKTQWPGYDLYDMR